MTKRYEVKLGPYIGSSMLESFEMLDMDYTPYNKRHGEVTARGKLHINRHKNVDWVEIYVSEFVETKNGVIREKTVGVTVPEAHYATLAKFFANMAAEHEARKLTNAVAS